MTREEQLVFCTKCVNRKMDFSQGLICNLTGCKATFQVKCDYFERDETVKEKPLDDKEDLFMPNVRSNFSNEVLEKLKLEQNLFLGIITGLIVGILGAVLWSLVTVLTLHHFSYIALVIGTGIGFTVRTFGKGIDYIFGIWGAFIALFSIFLGNFLSIVGFVSQSENLSYFKTLVLLNYKLLPQIMVETFSVYDLGFYGIAIFTGYKFSFRKITEKQLFDLKQKMSS